MNSVDWIGFLICQNQFSILNWFAKYSNINLVYWIEIVCAQYLSQQTKIITATKKYSYQTIILNACNILQSGISSTSAPNRKNNLTTGSVMGKHLKKQFHLAKWNGVFSSCLVSGLTCWKVSMAEWEEEFMLRSCTCDEACHWCQLLLIYSHHIHLYSIILEPKTEKYITKSRPMSSMQSHANKQQSNSSSSSH